MDKTLISELELNISYRQLFKKENLIGNPYLTMIQKLIGPTIMHVIENSELKQIISPII